MTRTRSEYRSAGLPASLAATTDQQPAAIRPVAATDYGAVAALMLDAYRGTIDDEGEGDAEAKAAIDHYFANIEWQHSCVLENDAGILAMSFVVTVDGRRYIDPVATSAASKRRGHGRTAVLASLRSLASDGCDDVGAVITDGNVPSERLFRSLGFQRVGPWDSKG